MDRSCERRALGDQFVDISCRCGDLVSLFPCFAARYLTDFVLTSSDGLALDFFTYTGKGTVHSDDMKANGLGGAVLIQVVSRIDNMVSTIVGIGELTKAKKWRVTEAACQN